MPRLTKRFVDAAKPKEIESFYWDEEIPGFGLRVKTSGRRLYFIQYRAGGRTRRLGLGLHGVLTPEDARRRAKDQLGGWLEAKTLLKTNDKSASRTARRFARRLSNTSPIVTSENTRKLAKSHQVPWATASS